MVITPSELIEEIIDELALGDLGQQVDFFAMHRVDAATVLLDYGDGGRFRLTVTVEP